MAHLRRVKVIDSKTPTYCAANFLLWKPGDLSFQWCRNGQAVNGATGPALVIESVGVENAGDYSVEVSDSRGGNIESNPVELIVPGAVSAPRHLRRLARTPRSP